MWQETHQKKAGKSSGGSSSASKKSKSGISKVITATPSFNFHVFIDGFKAEADSMFSEVGGMSFELEVEDFKDGGNNATVHHLPKGSKHSNLILKRGISPMGSALTTWCMETMNFKDNKITRKVISVMLMGPDPKGNENPKSIPIHTWEFYDAFPVKWQISEFVADKSAIAIESIEFVYAGIKSFV